MRSSLIVLIGLLCSGMAMGQAAPGGEGTTLEEMEKRLAQAKAAKADADKAAKDKKDAAEAKAAADKKAAAEAWAAHLRKKAAPAQDQDEPRSGDARVPPADPATAHDTSQQDDSHPDAALRAKWQTRQAEMQGAFQLTSAFQGSPAAQRAAWDRFLSTYSDKNPYSDEDERLRADAKARRAALPEPEKPNVASGSPAAPPLAAIQTAVTKPAEPAPPDAAAALPSGTALDQYNHAFGLLREANYPLAETAFRTLLQEHPDDPLAANAQYWLGETYFMRADYTAAVTAFDDGLQKFPASPKASDMLLKLAISLGASGRKPEACADFARFEREFPPVTPVIKERLTSEKRRAGC